MSLPRGLAHTVGIAFMLADKGFDVWMTNIRGNVFSRKHERFSPDSAEFWNYS